MANVPWCYRWRNIRVGHGGAVYNKSCDPNTKIVEQGCMNRNLFVVSMMHHSCDDVVTLFC